MTDLLCQISADERAALVEKRMPGWTEPMLATLTDERFSSAEWIFERKLDGERCLAFKSRNRVALFSRNRTRLNATYPELVDALKSQAPARCIADGEIVAFDGNLTSFARLQKRMGVDDPDKARKIGVAVYLYLFDLLYLDGYDTTGLRLRTRKRLLRRAFDFDDPLRFTAHRNVEGQSFYKDACRRGWEGIIAKRADSAYVHSRSRDWLKFKCVKEQELVIAGYTDPQGSRKGFGALLLGYYDAGELRYAGKVGTGFDDATLESIGAALERRAESTCPFADAPAARRGVHWVRPDLVAEIGFTEWTKDGRLRHPRFLGLRDDKQAGDVVRERPARR